MKNYKFSDAIIGRILNVIQEAMLSGIDVLDLFRQMEVVPSPEDEHVLVLTPEYQKTVDRWHEEIEEDFKKRAERLGGALPGTGGSEVKAVGGVVAVDPEEAKKLN